MSKLNFYVGNFTDEKLGGTKTNEINIKCFNSTKSSNYYNETMFRFALRCDGGYIAKNVKLYAKGIGNNVALSIKKGDYSSLVSAANGWSSLLTYNIGTVTSENTHIIVHAYYINNAINKPENSFPLEVSYDIEEVFAL